MQNAAFAMTMTALPRLSEKTDDELALLVRNGSPEAIDAIYDRYATQLLRFAYRLIGSIDDAEDVVQDVFVGLPRAIARYEERGRFEAWLRRITTRVALARMRRDTRRRRWNVHELENQQLRMEDFAERLALEDAISRLPSSLRSVFVLRKIGGYSHAEIAALLGIQRGASEVRLYRAIRLLRTMLRSEP